MLRSPDEVDSVGGNSSVVDSGVDTVIVDADGDTMSTVAHFKIILNFQFSQINLFSQRIVDCV